MEVGGVTTRLERRDVQNEKRKGGPKMPKEKERSASVPCHVGCCILLLGVALVVLMVGCVLVCSTFKGRRMHCKHERAANANLGSHSSQRRSDVLRTSCCLVLLLQ